MLNHEDSRAEVDKDIIGGGGGELPEGFKEQVEGDIKACGRRVEAKLDNYEKEKDKLDYTDQIRLIQSLNEDTRTLTAFVSSYGNIISAEIREWADALIDKADKLILR